MDPRELVLQNLDYADHTAKWFMLQPHIPNRIGSLDDIRQVCCLAMVKASIKYRPEKSQFHTYAITAMRNQLRKANLTDGFIHIPTGTFDVSAPNYDAARAELGRRAFYNKQFSLTNYWKEHGVHQKTKHKDHIPTTLDANQDPILDIQEAIKKLPPIQGMVLTEVFLKHKTLREIGSRCGTSYQSIQTIKNKALKAIRKYLDGYEPEGMIA